MIEKVENVHFSFLEELFKFGNLQSFDSESSRHFENEVLAIRDDEQELILFPKLLALVELDDHLSFRGDRNN